MPKIEVDKSIFIQVPAATVFEVVSDLSQWRPWNPWLITDPSVTVSIHDGGKGYNWEGPRSGAGEMKIAAEQFPTSVELDLRFFKPFKSKAQAQFAFESEGEGTRVKWSMRSGMPFYLFFLTKMMKTMIGMDYERGLSMLKDKLETGKVPSKIEYPGEMNYPGCDYVGLSSECAMAELAQVMSGDFQKLAAWQKESSLVPSADPFCTYRKWDLSKGRVKYTCGVPVASSPATVPDGFETGRIPPLKTYVLDHVGPYRHLGNAWSAGMQMQQAKEFRSSKVFTPFETYSLRPDGSLPGKDSDETTRTSIHFPIE